MCVYVYICICTCAHIYICAQTHLLPLIVVAFSYVCVTRTLSLFIFSDRLFTVIIIVLSLLSLLSFCHQMSGDISTPAARLLRSVVPIVPWIYIIRVILYIRIRSHEAIVRFEGSTRHERRSLDANPKKSFEIRRVEIIKNEGSLRSGIVFYLSRT